MVNCPTHWFLGQANRVGKLDRWIVAEFMRPIVAVGRVIGKIYDTLFGRAEVRLSKKNEEQLALDIKADLAFLFDKYGGRFVSDDTVPHPRPFDYAVVLVAIDGLLLPIIRGRGELSSQITARELREWHDLNWVFGLVDTPERIEWVPLSCLADLALALRPRIRLIQEAFSPSAYPEIKRRLSDIYEHERAAARQLQNEINRQIYGK